MTKLKFRYLIVLIIFAAYLAGCATIPGGKPGPGTVEAEAKMVEAAGALDSVNERSGAFYAQLGAVIEEIKRFCDRPGWMEFEQILLEYPSLRDPDADIEITPEIEARLADWGRAWNASGEETLVAYRDLVDKCIIMEAKRLALRERLLTVQAKYLAAVMLELSAGREQQAQEIYSVVEVLDKSGAELNSYQTDDLGLYKFR
ncbi:MAG: hypothetical protein WAW37_16575 [Syntrophobacteraceae bacterium]